MTGNAPGFDVLDHFETFEAPPRGFDVHSAPAHALLKHGLPQRPDAATHRRLDQSWQRAFSQPPNYVKAELAVDEVMSARERPVFQRGAEEFDIVNKWAGAVVHVSQLGFGEPVKTVFAQWSLPHVWPYDPDLFSFPITAGFWVGIDGFLQQGPQAQVLQAGVAVTVPKWTLGSPTIPAPTYWAWTEWWTERYKQPAVAVSNFPVKAGDTIFVLVCAPEPERGYVSFLNVSTGQQTSVGLYSRPGIWSQGESAEWIVEMVSPDLPAFDPLTFNECAVASETSAIVRWQGWK
jgi:hypothetical protein